MRALLFLALLGGCRQLDRSTKVACDSKADCLGLLTECVANVCVKFEDRFNTSGPTGVSDDPENPVTNKKECLQSNECGTSEVCTDKKCIAAVTRDYPSTAAAFRRMLCETAIGICGDARSKAFYGATDPLTACLNAEHAPWYLTLGPIDAKISSWHPESAARCVADTRSVLLYGLDTPTFSSLPRVCDDIGYTDSIGTGCTEGQVECSFGYCTKPPSYGASTWRCASSYATFGETCYDRTRALPDRLRDTCVAGHYCDIALGTCQKQRAAGESCVTQSYTQDNDPTYSPCVAKYSCGMSGTCVPFVAKCPLPEVVPE